MKEITREASASSSLLWGPLGRRRSLGILSLCFLCFCNPIASQANPLSMGVKVVLSVLCLISGSRGDSHSMIAQGTFSSPEMKWDSQKRAVMIYHDIQTSSLGFIRCGDHPCNTIDVKTTLAIGGDVGHEPDFVLDDYDIPYIVCRNATDNDLLFIQCGDPLCTTYNQVLLDKGNLGFEPSIRLGKDGFPGTSYYDRVLESLKFAKCSNKACTGNIVISLLDSFGNVGRYSSQTLDIMGNPLIVYYSISMGSLNFFRCAMPSCEYNSMFLLLDYEGDVGLSPFIRLRKEGVPTILYYDKTNGALKLYYCTNSGCTLSKGIFTISNKGLVGKNLIYAVQLNNNDLPVIAYIDPQPPYYLMLMACQQSDCTGNNNIYMAIAPLGEGSQNSTLTLQLDIYGNAGIGYYNASSNHLELTKITLHPTQSPTRTPTRFPSKTPSYSPTRIPTTHPTHYPSTPPSLSPTRLPTKTPIIVPTATPTSTQPPSTTPTSHPSTMPSWLPSLSPSYLPTYAPLSTPPTQTPTNRPTKSNIDTQESEEVYVVNTTFSKIYQEPAKSQNKIVFLDTTVYLICGICLCVVISSICLCISVRKKHKRIISQEHNRKNEIELHGQTQQDEESKYGAIPTSLPMQEPVASASQAKVHHQGGSTDLFGDDDDDDDEDQKQFTQEAYEAEGQSSHLRDEFDIVALDHPRETKPALSHIFKNYRAHDYANRSYDGQVDQIQPEVQEYNPLNLGPPLDTAGLRHLSESNYPSYNISNIDEDDEESIPDIPMDAIPAKMQNMKDIKSLSHETMDTVIIKKVYNHAQQKSFMNSLEEKQVSIDDYKCEDLDDFDEPTDEDESDEDDKFELPMSNYAQNMIVEF